MHSKDIVVADAAVIEEIWDRIDCASDAMNSSERSEKLHEIIAYIEELIAIRSSNARLWYALGYARYMLPNRIKSSKISASTVYALKKACALDRKFPLPQLYLAYHFYDVGKIEEAAIQLSNGAPKLLAPYMALKWAELDLCCFLQLFGFSRGVERVKQFVTIARQHPVEDIAPFVLAKLLKERSDELRNSKSHELVSCCRELDHLGGFTNWL